MPGYLGVDLTASARTPAAYALLDERLAVTALGFFRADEALLDLLAEHRPDIVALDAPLGLPGGWSCLDDPCSCNECSDAALDKRRTSEIELRRRGIPCYWTTRRSIIKQMVYRGIRLRSMLESRGCCVLEIFPYAAKVRLWGKQLPKKHRPEGIAYLREALLGLLPSLGEASAELDHDRADALLAAYTAWLHVRGDTEILGGAVEGQIVIPKEGLATNRAESLSNLKRKGSSARRSPFPSALTAAADRLRVNFQLSVSGFSNQVRRLL